MKTAILLPLLHALSLLSEAAAYSNHDETWALGNGYSLQRSAEKILIADQKDVIWSAALPFLSASAGQDQISGTSGAFNITKVDEAICQEQDISSISKTQWDEAVNGAAVQLAGSLLDCGDEDMTYIATFWVPEDLSDRIAFDIKVSSGSSGRTYQRVYLTFDSNADEDIYGLGAQASFASLKGQDVPVFTREQGVGRGDMPVTQYENANGTFAGGNRFTTYTSIPSYVSTDSNGFYLSLDSTALTFLDFTKSDTTTVRYGALNFRGALFRASNMFEAVERLTAYTGRMPALPSWVDEGAVLGVQGGQRKVSNIVQEGLDLECPIAAVWLQDWSGTHAQEGPYINVSRLWWNWENDEVLYPEWPAFVQGLRSQHGVRTLSYINTFLANVSTKPDGFRRNLYAEADRLHYTVQNTTTNSTAIISSGPGLDAGIIDLTNPGLRSWFGEVMRSQVWNFANISGFMSDFGEYTPVTPDTSLYNTSDALFFHNSYPYLWAQYQRQLVESLDLQDEALLFHRSASMNSNRYMNLFWVGDQNVDWGLNDGIKSVVTIMTHMGLSGYSQQHSDIGGYTTVLTYSGFNITRSPELLGRWGELAAVSSAVFRSHEGNIPEVNAQFYSNAGTYGYYAYNARMFVSLAPYRRKILETECATRGWPLLRPPVMYHTDDAEARKINYQSFYLGPSLYVAPVLDPHTFELEVYLPGRCEFTHVWTGMRYHGGQRVRVGTPYGKPAVFLVGGNEMPELESFLQFVKRENGTSIDVA
ncbi:uncharacterized protein LTR77_007267 [Saxophila tyrrhenica]|uniref:Alpha-glucosidase n=1 Tax=Saxophila tyrrhenica TaxID=1690608 RepID=A0AAV9P4Z2_9PEZI|nr:hypothetical protein LTR77_007267 [Saxophila tyrrhenica]